jgi:pseudaminic acid cytidylyltransferase
MVKVQHLEKTIAVIPARGGSKRIPRKNIRAFRGIPAISRTIQFVLSTGMFSEIIVSTDDQEIKEISLEAGATFVVKRSKELAGDFIPTVPVISNALQQFDAQLSRDSNICCFYPVNPFLDISNLVKGLELLRGNRAINYVNPVVTFSYPIERALEMDLGGVLKMHNPKHIVTRSQDLREFVHDAGQWYWGRAETWLLEAPLLMNSMGVNVPRWVSQDIDTIEDWHYAELLFGIQESIRHGS